MPGTPNRSTAILAVAAHARDARASDDMSSRKVKAFRAVKEVKRQARLRVGTPPPVQRHESRKRKAPKHKKQQWEEATEAF
jgi:hypothetical protein